MSETLESVAVKIEVNGDPRTITVEPRTTLLDALREQLALTGTKKGCDRGECGACTVHVDGRRVLSCMTLAAMQAGKRITTIEGLEHEGKLHPLQAGFIEHDGFQCGFCTSGQIMSAVAMIEEAKAGWPSAATANAATATLTMSTNPARPACDILALPAENEDSRWIGIADFQREPLSVSHAPSCGKRPNPDVDRHAGVAFRCSGACRCALRGPNGRGGRSDQCMQGNHCTVTPPHRG